MPKKSLVLIAVAALALAASAFHVTGSIKLGGTGGWDYLTLDPATRLLYVSHSTSVEVVDIDAGKKIANIPDTPGVHGIAIASDLHRGFISNGRSNNVTVFDLKTRAKIADVATGTNPDAICYEPKTQRIFTFNGRSNDSTSIDAKTLKVLATFPVGPKPEFCAVDGAGKLYANIENSSEIVEIDAAANSVTRRASLAPCEEPSGLAIDTKGRKLFSVCGNKLMAITDIASFKVVGTTAIGAGSDGAAFDPELGLAFSSNGRDGTVSVVKSVNGKFQTVDTVKSASGARTITLDPKRRQLLLPTAEFAPAAAGQKGRPAALPDSFQILILGQ